jgi:3-dehydroquinate dehydratase
MCMRAGVSPSLVPVERGRRIVVGFGVEGYALAIEGLVRRTTNAPRP